MNQSQRQTGTIVHAYMGPGETHPIIGNYIRSADQFDHEILLPGRSNGRLRRILQALVRFLHLRFRSKAVTAVHTHDVINAVFANILLKSPVVFDCHEIYHALVKRGVVVSIVRALERMAFNMSEVLVFPSDERRDYYDSQGKWREKTFIVENLSMHPESASLPEQRDATHALYAGALKEDRGIPEIVEAFRRPELQAMRLTIAGREWSWWREYMRAHRLPPNVSYVGELSRREVNGLLNECGIGLALYRPTNKNNELSAPTKVFEYLSCGLGVVATASPYLLRIVEARDLSGLKLVPVLEPVAIAEAIIELSRRVGAGSIKQEPSCRWAAQQGTIDRIYGLAAMQKVGLSKP